MTARHRPPTRERINLSHVRPRLGPRPRPPLVPPNVARVPWREVAGPGLAWTALIIAAALLGALLARSLWLLT